MKPPVYIGAFLDVESQWRLFAMCPPVHPNVYGDHVTLKFKPSVEDMDKWSKVIGREIGVYVAAFVEDDRGQAAHVLLDVYCENEKPHVTISTANGTKPVYSNELLRDVDYSKIDSTEFKAITRAQGKQLRAVIDTYPRTKRI